ncbi:signal recognition particle-docking protein FtsY [Candidatus Woesearchaeota archaeon]|nr:MAG: signal recognition particle-docking protein FtsY [Candidatus Woesearchaeota archaeon]
MFGFLKKKLKQVVGKFSKKVDEEAEIKEEIVEVEEKVEAKTKEPVKTEVSGSKKEVELKGEGSETKRKSEVVEPAPKKKEPVKPAELKVEETTAEKAEQKKGEEKRISEEKISEEEKVEKKKAVEVSAEKEEAKSEVSELRKEAKTEKSAEGVVEEKLSAEEILEEVAEEERTKAKEAAKAAVVESKPKHKERPVFDEEKPKGFFRKLKHALTTKKISEGKFDELFWDLELALLENNTAIEVIEKIKSDLKRNIVEKPLPKGKIEEIIISSLRYSIEDLFFPNFDLVDHIKHSEKRPFVICFVGINGSGKTTTIAKVANLLQKNGLSVVMAAADTFRAAAIDQLQLHANNLGVKLIRHDYGSDPAAVAFDAVKHAESTGKDVVLIDTAGRIHSNVNLMEELSKIIRVAKPDLKIFVGESITGNDCTEQAKKFDDAVGIDGIILSKADVDDKGGAAISVSYVTKKPILYLGTGQEYDDLEFFRKEKILESIGF